MTRSFLTPEQELIAFLQMSDDADARGHGLGDVEEEKLLNQLNYVAMMAAMWVMWKQSATSLGVKLPEMNIEFKLSGPAAAGSTTPDSDSGGHGTEQVELPAEAAATISDNGFAQLHGSCPKCGGDLEGTFVDVGVVHESESVSHVTALTREDVYGR